MNRAEFWSWVHLYYGDDLGLTSDDDDDYEPLTTEDRSKFQILLNTELDATVVGFSFFYFFTVVC